VRAIGGPLSLGGGFGSYLEGGHWEANLTYRYLFADEIFRGSVYQPQFQAGRTNAEITIHSLDLSVTYAFTKRFGATLTFPFIDGTVDVVSNRVHNSSRGLGDMRLMGTTWLFTPETHPDGNIALGIGVKFPTGDDAVTDWTTINGVTSQRPVDPALQLGDGGWGIPLELVAFHKLFENMSVYVSGAYLINPRRKSDTEFTTDPSVHLSVPDSYFGRAGFTYTFWPEKGLSLSFGGRVDGVPVRDLIGGGDDGFRRPGYTVYVEPGIGWVIGKNFFSLSGPVAVDRNRETSIRDLQAGLPSGVGGLASFVLVGSYTRRF
jgi:hypothetical protein